MHKENRYRPDKNGQNLTCCCKGNSDSNTLPDALMRRNDENR